MVIPEIEREDLVKAILERNYSRQVRASSNRDLF